VIVQIYSLSHPDDVRMLVEAGVDHVGVAPTGQGLPAGISAEGARGLFELLPPGVLGSALSVLTDLDWNVAMAETARPAIFHVCCETEAMSVAEQNELRSRLPAGMLVMKAIEVGGPETGEAALAAAERFAPVSDFLLLDTKVEHIPGIGAAGLVHDWDVSARIVERVGRDVPVILAGGLGPENVAAAIAHVRPAGVDSFTLTNTAHDRRRKDPDRVRAFVSEARRAAAPLGL
jgi:phosphoribosylanthranilate isomerase